ncbi:MAG: hypothetical protein EOM32_04635 [Spirochaetia bacterium]|nr:hypothetical protein [Spirochaetia bacterium]
MKRSLRLALMITMVLLLCTAGQLFAEEISITWEWDVANEDVTAFRYQLDGEEPDKWTVVDTSVTSYTLGPIEDTSFHILYLQQSYDGEQWSASATMVYDPVEFGTVLPPTEEDTQTISVAEPEVMVVDEPVEIVSDDSVVQVEAVAVEEVEPKTFDDFVVAEGPAVITEVFGGDDAVETIPEVEAVETEPSRRRIELYAGAGGKTDNLIFQSVFDPNNDYKNPRTRILPSVALDFIYGNIKPNDSMFDFGIRAGLGYSGYEVDGKALVGIDIHGLAMLEYPISERLVVDAAAGLSFMFTGSAIHTIPSTDLGFFIGPIVQLNGRYLVDERWSVGLQAETRFLLGGAFKPFELSGIVRLGFGYDF